MRKFFKIFSVTTFIIILAIIINILSFPGIRGFILSEIVKKHNYPLFVRLTTLGISKDQLINTVINFQNRLRRIGPNIPPMDNEEIVHLKSMLKTGYDVYGKCKILDYYSASRDYPIYQLGTNFYLDPRTCEIIAFDWKIKVLHDLAEGKERLKKNITKEEIGNIANKYLELIGKPPDTGDPILLGVYNHKGRRSNFDYYCVYFPKVYKGYEYDPIYSGIWIEIAKDNGELVGYRKKFWKQKSVSVILNISKDEAIQRIRKYNWEKIEKQGEVTIVRPIEIGEPKLFIVSPNYWPYLWKEVLFLNRSRARLVWEVPIKFLKFPSSSPSWIDVYVDAKTGKIVGAEGWFYGNLGEL